MKIFIPVIAYGGQVHTEYMFSMMSLQSSLVKNNINGFFYPIVNESLISRGRNSAAAYFLQSDCDYLFFVDTDISFTPNDFNEVAKLKKPLAIGAYCKKYMNKEKIEEYAKRNTKFNPDWQEYVTDFSTEVPPQSSSDITEIEVNYGATGFMLIHKSVFLKIIEKHPELKYKNDIDFYMSGGDNFYDFFSVGINEETKKYESEDYGFCRLWKSIGGKIHCATNTNLVHIGRQLYRGNLKKQLNYWYT